MGKPDDDSAIVALRREAVFVVARESVYFRADHPHPSAIFEPPPESQTYGEMADSCRRNVVEARIMLARAVSKLADSMEIGDAIASRERAEIMPYVHAALRAQLSYDRLRAMGSIEHWTAMAAWHDARDPNERFFLKQIGVANVAAVTADADNAPF